MEGSSFPACGASDPTTPTNLESPGAELVHQVEKAQFWTVLTSQGGSCPEKTLDFNRAFLLAKAKRQESINIL